MEIIKFFQPDYWKDATLAVNSEHENFLGANTQNPDFNVPWRSNYGAGSHWGRFQVTAANNKIDFEETVSTPLVATIANAVYHADSYCAAIKTALDAAGASTYTVTYSDTTNKITVTSDGGGGGGILNLLWSSGANKANSAAGTMGFDDSADDTGSLTYVADNLRIHSEEIITADFGAAKNIYGAIIRGHNLQAGATVNLYFSTNNFTSTAETLPFTVQDDILVLQYDTPKNYRYARIGVIDVDNPDLYIQLGTIITSGQFQPGRNFHALRRSPRDPSVVFPSEDGQESSFQLSRYSMRSYGIRVKGSSDVASFDSMFKTFGASKALVICEDPASPLTNTFFVKFNDDVDWVPVRKSTDFWDLSFSVREMR